MLHVGKFYPPHKGGIESYVEVLCRELSKCMDVRVLVANETREVKEEFIDGVHVVRLGTLLTLASTPLCPGMTSRIRNSESDLVHIHLPNPAAVIAYLKSGYKGRVVYTYHGDVVRQKRLDKMFRLVQRAALRRSSAIIVSSPHLLSSPVLAEFRDKCRVIPFGVSVEDFSRVDEAAVMRLRQMFGDRIVLSVGRLVYYKGLEYAIRAMVDVPGTLLIVGGGPLRPQLEALVSQIGLNQRVVFLGEIPDEQLRACYHASDVFVLASASRSEAFGIVQIEAMAAGRPVVNTQLDSGVPFVSLHGLTGLTVPPGDPGALSKAINQLLDDPELRASYGQASRLRATSEFSLAAMTSRTAELYQEVLAHRQEDLLHHSTHPGGKPSFEIQAKR